MTKLLCTRKILKCMWEFFRREQTDRTDFTVEGKRKRMNYIYREGLISLNKEEVGFRV